MIAIPGVRPVAEIGRGGFGTVYRGVQQGLGRTVAVKVLRASVSEGALERFQRECRALSALTDEPHVVTVHDAGVTRDGHPYLVMAYLPGGSLAARLRRGPIEVDQALRAGRDVARGLAAAHATGVLHRDVKPENVLVSAQGGATLVDFGIATMGGAETTSHAVTTTLGYASPEVLDGSGVDERSDVYSAGALLHHLLSGSPPFAPQPGQPLAALIARVATQPPPDLRERGVAPAVAAVVERAMAKAPEDRFVSAADLAQAIEQAAAALSLSLAPLPVDSGPDASGGLANLADPGTAPTTGPVDDGSSPTTVVGGRSRTSPTADDHEPPARGRRRIVLTAAAVAVALALAGAGAAFGLSRAPEGPGGAEVGAAASSTTATPTSTAGNTTAPSADAPSSTETTGHEDDLVPPPAAAPSTAPAVASSGVVPGAATDGWLAEPGTTRAPQRPTSTTPSAVPAGTSPAPSAAPEATVVPETTVPQTSPPAPPAPPAAVSTVRVGAPVVTERRADGEPTRVQVRLSWAPGHGAPADEYEVRRTVYVGGSPISQPRVLAQVAAHAYGADVVSDRIDHADSYALWEVSATGPGGRSAWTSALVEVPPVADQLSWDATQLLRVAGARPAYRPLTVKGAQSEAGRVWAQSPRSGTVVPGDFVLVGVWSPTTCGSSCNQPWPGDPARS